MKAKVVHGRKIGRELGFPTANLIWIGDDLHPEKLGVYLVRITLNGQPFKGLMNVGMRPTFGKSELSSEVHILDFKDDIYDQMVDVEILDFIRPEKKFDSKEDLVRQIQSDLDFVLKM